MVETNLSNLVGEVRAALGEDPRHPRFLRTVHRFGYAFRDAPAEAAPPEPRGGLVYRLIWKGGRATVADGEHVVGRDPELELSFDSPSVSRRHARVRVGEGQAVLEDLGSKNGTFVNGNRVTAPVTLSDRDEIRFGSLRVKFRILSPLPSTDTVTTREE